MSTVERSNARPRAFTLIGLFFYFGGFMSSYAALTLARPGTFLDRLWVLNRDAHIQLAALGSVIAVPFAVLGAVMFLAGYGWFRRRYWAWLLGVSVVATNCAADLVHAALGDWVKSGFGVLVAGSFLFYLTRPAVRTYFLPLELEGPPEKKAEIDSSNG